MPGMKPFGSLTRRGQLARLRRLADAVLEEYGLRHSRLTPLGRMENTTFQVEHPASGPYVLRIHRPGGDPTHPRRCLEEIRSEMQWLAAIRRDTDLSVPEPVPARDGSLVTVGQLDGIPEPRPCVLFRWMDGRFLDTTLTEAHLERVGVFMARLQLHGAAFLPPEGFTRPKVADLSDKLAATFAAVRPAEELVIVERVTERAREVIRLLGDGADVYGLIHADLHQWNYLFHGGEVRAIDFDDCGYGLYLYDLAVTLQELQGRDRYPALRGALLRGYRSIRPLPEQQEPYIDALLAFRLLQLLAWFVEERHHPSFTWWETAVAEGIVDLRGRLATD